jgi:hypothetical protein
MDGINVSLFCANIAAFAYKDWRIPQWGGELWTENRTGYLSNTNAVVVGKQATFGRTQNVLLKYVY